MSKRVLNRLSARGIASSLKPGRYADGGGLYLVVTSASSRKWVFRYARNGKQRDMGLGAEGETSLAAARDAATRARAHLRAGKDPLAERQRERQDGRPVPTFGEFADELIDSIAPGFRNQKHILQWRTTLRTHAAALRPRSVDAIATEDVLSVLKPLWQSKAETAGRLRGRIERVLDAAKVKGFRSGENPARWRGHLDALLPRRHKLSRGHHAALAHADLSDFLLRLRAAPGTAARSLEFLILTCARTGEVTGMRWDELSPDGKVWTVPAARMKAGREHRVPLCEGARDLLAALPRDASGLVFPGRQPGKPQSEMTLLMQLRRLHEGVTVHGFRSTFRDWVDECTHFPGDLAEAALAHIVGDATERAYRRGDALEKRRELMAAWGAYCAGASNVIAIGARF
ncbi:MAG: integrase arm-type DNA-binding domain-containing protein [Pseudolabrys sp.]|nr:integrase arm-type DNA-binding domain-containing protein [Pseudolabrys sp.]